MKKHLILACKGFSIGIANVIPGVSGGTIALVTGIFEKLIDSIKSFDITAAKLLLSGRFKDFAAHVNLSFLIAVFGGAGLGIISFAKVLDYLFANYPVLIWAFFFGLILGSAFFVGRRIGKWSISAIVTFALGAASAAPIVILNPAAENGAAWYLFICGAVAICSMILPGISGSFVLILMGNYRLVMIEGVTTMKLAILIPFGLGAAGGLIAFSHFLSWVLKKFPAQTLALLTGFVLGSMLYVWPWQKSFDAQGNIMAINRFGAFLSSDGAVIGGVKRFGFRPILPESFDLIIVWAAVLVLAGIAAVWALERRKGIE